MVHSGSAKGSGFGMKLTTWPEVHRHLAAIYDVRAERDGVIDLVVTLGAAGAGGSARLEVSRADVLGATWIQIASVIGSLRHLSHLQLLADNAQAIIGVFATRDGALVARQTLPLAGLDVAYLDETIRDIFHLATSSRQRLTQMGVPIAPWRLPGSRAR
jgi:hypothetical protein